MDLVADVLQNADANRLRVATSKLTGIASKMASKASAAEFQKVSVAQNNKHIRSADDMAFKKDQSRIPGGNIENVQSLPKSRDMQRKEAMQGLETVLATKMIEAMMPDDQSELYGDGTAGEIWRGFHIDTMGKAMASQKLFSGASHELTEKSPQSPGNGRNKPIVPFAG